MRNNIVRLLLTFIAVVELVPTACFDFAAHQFTLYHGNPAPLAYKGLHTSTCPLPSIYSSLYSRALVQAGLKVEMKNLLDLVIYLEPATSDTLAQVTIYPSQASIYQVSVYIVCVYSASNWVWVHNDSWTFTNINTVGQSQETIQTVASFPVDSATQTAFAYLTYFSSQSTAGGNTGLTLQVTSLIPSTTIELSATNRPGNQARLVSYVVLVVDQSSMASSTVVGGFGTPNATQIYPLTSPTNFGILDIYQRSSTGYDGNCLTGLHSIWLAGGTSAFMIRSVLFDATTNPFSAVQNIIAGSQSFEAKWNLVCLSLCPNTTYFNAGSCTVICQVANCQSCASAYVCQTCSPDYLPTNGSSYCDSCQNVTMTCLSCLNESVCSACVSYSYGLDNSSFCFLCFTMIPECMYCHNYTYCTACLNDTHAVTNNHSVCQLCSVLIGGCQLCTTDSQCSQCIQNYGVNSTGGCQQCSAIIPFCSQCLNYTFCLTCVNNSYIPDSAYSSCMPCSTANSDCLECTSSTFCTRCADSYYLTSGTSQYCLSCTFAVPNCLLCSDASTCSQCVSSSYYLAPDGSCQPCSAVLTNCLTCSTNTSLSEYNCTLCSSLSVINSSQQCEVCSDIIPNCLFCVTPTNCTDCISNGYFYSFSAAQCLPCSDKYPYCLQCTSSLCTSCPPGLELVNNSLGCGCLLGQLVNGICTKIVGCIDPVNDPEDSCLQCNSTLFQTLPVNGLCLCKEGKTLINGLCSGLEGCMTPVFVNGVQTCAFCDIVSGFISEPDTNGDCICPEHYQNLDGACADICGDEYLAPSSRYSCDDGNAEDGDGCSSSCQIEVGYRCEAGSSGESNCIYIGIPITISLKYIQRSQGLNQGVFKFDISPAILNLRRMDLNQHASMNCPGTTYEISSIDYIEGTLAITADYSTDMEGLPCDFTLSFDPSIVQSQNASVSFEAVSRNSPLRISMLLSQFSTVKLIFGFLAYVILGAMVLSLPHKMIGPQLLFSSQMVFLSNALFATPSFLCSSMKTFTLVTGNWSFYFSDSDKELLYPFTERVEITDHFLEDTLFVVLALFVIGVAWLLAYLINHCCQRRDRVESRGESSRAETALKMIYMLLFFPAVAGFFCIIAISAYVNNLRVSNIEGQFSFVSDSAALFLSWFILATVTAFECTGLRDQKSTIQMKGLRGAKKWYIPLFLFRLIVVTLLMQAGIALSFDLLIYPIAIVMILYLSFIVAFRPYSSVIETIGLILCQMTSIYSIFQPLLGHFTSISQRIELLMLLVLEGLLMLTSLFSLIRIVRVYKEMIAQCCLKKKEQEEGEGDVGRSSRRERLMSELDGAKEMQRINPYSVYKHRNKGGDHSTDLMKKQQPTSALGSFLTGPEPRQETELDILKKKLRGDLLRKKMRLNEVEFS